MKRKIRDISVTLILFGLVLGGPSSAQAALDDQGGAPTLVLSARGSRPIATSIGGLNVSNAMNLTKSKAAIAVISPPTFTWPAGNVGDDFPQNRQELSFLRLQQKFLPDAIWFNQVNLFKGSLADALEQIATARELGVRTDFWTIGNEPDLYGVNRGDKTWTPRKYAEVFREWTKAIKARYPDALVSGPAVSNPNDEWIKVFIEECGDLVDVLNWHWYPTNGKADDATALKTSEQAGPMVAKYRAWMSDPERNPKGHSRKIRTAVSEFSIHWDTPNEIQINDIIGACWTADVLGRFAESGLDFSHYFCLGEYGGHAILNQMGKPRIMYRVFQLYAGFGKAERLLASSGSAREGLLTAYGWVEESGAWTVIAVNRSAVAAHPLSIRLDGLPAADVAATKMLTASSFEAIPEADCRLIPATEGASLRLELPGHSTCAIRLVPLR